MLQRLDRVARCANAMRALKRLTDEQEYIARKITSHTFRRRQIDLVIGRAPWLNAIPTQADPARVLPIATQ